MVDSGNIQQRQCSVESGEATVFCREYEDSDLCIIENCRRPIIAKGCCTRHYARWKKYGDPLACHNPHLSFSRPEELKSAFKDRCQIDANGCWIWQRTRLKNYGQQCVDGKPYLAHRVSLAIYSGFDLNSPLMACHKCDVPLCCNPEHLFLGTAVDNSRDMVIKNRGAKGERNHASKLREKDIPIIRSRLADGESQQTIADSYGVTQRVISLISRKLAWKHVA